MPKLDRLKAELQFDKQLIVVAVLCIAVTIWIVVNTTIMGWSLVTGAIVVITVNVFFIIKKRGDIRKLLQKIEDC